MVKQQIYDPITKKTKLLDPLGRKAREIYKYKIDQGSAPGTVLPPELTYINGRLKKVKTISNFNNVRRITYQQVESVFGLDQLSWLKKIMTSYSGKTIQVAYRFFVLDDNGILVEREDNNTYDVPKGKGFRNFWDSFYKFLRPIDSDSWIFSEEYNQSENINEQAQLLIMGADKVGEVNFQQFFLDGVTHCVFTPIKNWAEKSLMESNNKSSDKKMKAKLNKIEKYLITYKDGVPASAFQEICDSLDIGITIDTPSTLNRDTKFIRHKPTKNNNPRKIFKLINTRLNHIELNEVSDKSSFIEVSQEFLNDYVYDCIRNKKYCLWKGDLGKIYEVCALTNKYVLSRDEGYTKALQEFQEYNKLFEYRLEHFSNLKLSEFLIENVHCCQAMILNHPAKSSPGIYKDMLELTKEEREEEKQEQIGYLQNPLYKHEAEETIKIIDFLQGTSANNNENINHIDMEKAYTRGMDNTHYKGYLGKITDFRMTTKIQGIGIYQIKNIKNLPPLFEKLGVLYHGNSYPSPELEYYQSLGITFDIVGGCWGSAVNIDFGNDFLAGMYQKDKNDLSHYKRWFGCQMKLTEKERYNFTCENIECAELNNFTGDCDVRYNEHKKIGIIEYNKDKAFHSCHIASFCTSYCRMSIIEQLLKFKDINQIIAIQTDGIYYTGEVEIGKLFHRDKVGKGLNNITGDEFVSQGYSELLKLDTKPRKHNMVELHSGPGGCGKTYNNLKDKGLVSPIFIGPTWKLSRSKQKEFNIDCFVVQNLVHNNPQVYRHILNNYNTLIIDEVSMLNNKDKKTIMKRFKNHKIIFVGDLGYQLPPVEGAEFKKDNMAVIKYDKNYRCKCEKLSDILNMCRKAIKQNPDDYFINIKTIVKKFGFEIFDKNSIDYKVEDMIIAPTNKLKDFYTEKFKDLEKYIITENKGEYCNTQIVFQKPPVKHELRHAFTIHSIQGETATHKLFIDLNKMTSLRMAYTALSRGQYFDQIIFIQ